MRTDLPNDRISLPIFLHCCSISSTSKRFHAVFFQLLTHDSITMTKSHNCCYFSAIVVVVVVTRAKKYSQWKAQRFGNTCACTHSIQICEKYHRKAIKLEMTHPKNASEEENQKYVTRMEKRVYENK